MATTVSNSAFPNDVNDCDRQIATPVLEQGDETGPRRPPGKCCGCCCNYKMATMIVSGIMAVLEFLVLIFVATGAYKNLTYGGGQAYSGQEGWNDFMKKYEIIEIVFSVVSICLGAAAIFGAYNYNIVLVALNAIWIVGGFVAGIIISITACSDWNSDASAYYDTYVVCYNPPIASYFIAFLIIVAIIYPMVGFVVEVKRGILVPKKSDTDATAVVELPAASANTNNYTVPFGNRDDPTIYKSGAAAEEAPSSVETQTTVAQDGTITRKTTKRTKAPDGSTRVEETIEEGLEDVNL